jgi:hypothetical protein
MRAVRNESRWVWVVIVGSVVALGACADRRVSRPGVDASEAESDGGVALPLDASADDAFVAIDASRCGDGVCDAASEDTSRCPTDCPESCGDGVCDATSEDATRCAIDCPSPATCGDDVCAPRTENSGNCPMDCAAMGTCGDGICDTAENQRSCFADCARCPDGTCDASESVLACVRDCVARVGCGDGICDPDSESSERCVSDCPLTCGDGVCDAVDSETFATCPADCSIAPTQ